MYKHILLTEKEANLLVKTIEFFQDNNSQNTDQTVNLHIIKRHLMGINPTKNKHKNITIG